MGEPVEGIRCALAANNMCKETHLETSLLETSDDFTDESIPMSEPSWASWKAK